MMRFRSFGYALDYDREIKADLATIADVENVIARGWLMPDDVAATGIVYDLAWHLVSNEAAAAAFGIGLEERLALAWTMEYSEAMIALAGLPLRDPAIEKWYRVGDDIARRVNAATGWANNLPTLAQAKKCRSKAKADLARHRRNQAKFEPTKAVR